MASIEKKNPTSVLSDDEFIQCVQSGMTLKEIAEEYNVHLRTLYKRRDRLSKRLEGDHTTLRNNAVPIGYAIKGTSTLVHAEKGEMMTWVKTNVDAEKQVEMVRQAVAVLCEDLPREEPVPVPKARNSDLLNLFVLTDCHVGMLAWGEETGDDWDVKIAENLLTNWMGAAIAGAPCADTAVLCQLGDFLHFDGFDAVTPSSGHLLDADSRFQKLVRVALRILRRCINMLLETHQQVHVVMAEGNHDMASSRWLAETFAMFYEDESRVTVDVRPDPYYCYEFGKTSLFFHHGHKSRPAQLDSVFTAKFREVFGRTQYSYGHCGHLHHHKSEESRLMIIEQHQTLAAKDAYASRGGWLSKRGAKVSTYHKEYGLVGELTITPEMLK